VKAKEAITKPNLGKKVGYTAKQLPQKHKETTIYDDVLLASAHMQWYFADWVSLSKLAHEDLLQNSHKPILILLSAAAHLQIGDQETAKSLIKNARASGCSQELISKTLISGAHNSLGRAFAVDGQKDKSLLHFDYSVKFAPIYGDMRLALHARSRQELASLGIPVLGDLDSVSDLPIQIHELLKQALAQSPLDPALLIATAESEQRQGHYQDAIRLWQRLAVADGEQMPTSYYDRLEQAYACIGSFPLGSKEEEQLRGDGDKHEILKKIHFLLQPNNYLEIGVQAGKSLSLASCPAIGVDPMPQIKRSLGSNVQLIRTSSDEFFLSHAARTINTPLDLVFIDGMHFFEYALRDFMNTEKYADAYTLVLIDDIFPGHPAQADRDRRTRAWTGDVWKLLVTLKQHRPDLKLLMLDVFPTGLLCITGLNRNDHTLQTHYEKILQSFDPASRPTDEILMRQSSVSCSSSQLEQFIEEIKVLRGKETGQH
jgi:hypothetical protein